jgi:hypothetical protein
MDLYDELVKTSKTSDSNIYTGAKKELLDVVELLKTITREDAKKGLFSSTLQINQLKYPCIFYIYNDLDCLNSLSGTLNSLLDSSLDVVILSADTPSTLIIKVNWFRTLHMFLLDDLEKGK